jgi:2'-5' RNA ligase
MPRLFTGLEIPAEIGRELSGLRGGLPGARWVEPDNYHITLRFVGDIDDATARDLDAALRDSRPRPPIQVTLDRVDAFGGGKPRALFVRAVPTPDLESLQDEQERLVRRVGLPPESRRFTPHVTLARMRAATPGEVARYIVERGPIRKLVFTADRFVLYSARPSTGGGPYVVEAAYPFG